MIALACLPGFFAARALAKDGPPLESLQTSPALTKLAADARSLLNANLPATPKLDIRIDIGYATTPDQGNPSPADTFPATSTETGFGGAQTVTPVCEIVVNRPTWDASQYTGGYNGTGNGDRDRALEIVTHEEFHCYQLQLLHDPAYGNVPDWVKEGLPRWVDLSLFPAKPVPSSAADLRDYFKNPTTPLFTRHYDAVGFWSHLADVTHVDLWQLIPKIILASAHGSEATVNAALEGVTDKQFFDSWGSSAANPPGADAAWTAESPFPPRDPYASAPRMINIFGAPNTQVPVPLDPYSTIPIRIDPPAAPAGQIETVRIDLNGAYGRFGVETKTNYTGAALTDKTFCANATSCPTITASGSCPAGNSPPTLTPLPADALLGLAAARNHETVKINYASVPMTATCTPVCNGSSAHADTFRTAPTSAPQPDDVLLEITPPTSCELPQRSCATVVPVSDFPPPAQGVFEATTVTETTASGSVAGSGAFATECTYAAPPPPSSGATVASPLGFADLVIYGSATQAQAGYAEELAKFPTQHSPAAIGDQAVTTSNGGLMQIDNVLFVFQWLPLSAADESLGAESVLRDVVGSLCPGCT